MIETESKNQKLIHKPSAVRRLIFLSLLVSLLAYFLKNTLSYMLAHSTSPKLYGDFYISYKTIRTLATLSLAGLGTSAIRYIPGYLRPKKKEKLQGYIKWNYLRIIKVFIVYYLLLTSIDLFLRCTGVAKGYDTRSMLMPTLYCMPFLSLAYLWSSFLKASGSRWIGMLAKYLFRYGSASLAIAVLVYVFHSKPSYSDLKYIIIFSILFTCAACFILSWTLAHAIPQAITSLRIKKAAYEKSWGSTTLQYFISRIAFMGSNTAPFYIVIFAAANKKSIAYYAFLATLISVFRLITEGISVNLGNRVSYLHRKGHLDILKREVQNTNLAILITQSIIAFMFVFFSHQITDLFGSMFRVKVVHISLIILVLSHYLSSFSRTSIILLTYAGFQKKLLQLNLYSLVFVVVFGVPATTLYGLVGICSVFAAKYIIMSTVVIVWAKKNTGINPLIYRK